jgi:hypothetical protein
MIDDAYIKTLNERTKNNMNEFYFMNMLVRIHDPLPSHISLEDVMYEIETKVPKKYFKHIKSIDIGDFEFLNKREINAAYANDKIYISNKQEDEIDIADDVVHEVAHSVDEYNSELIYSDGLLRAEFLSKRKKLHALLMAYEFKVSEEEFMNPEYSQNFDAYLYHDIGYKLLTSIAGNLFYSPYAATSLKEYFANGFEAFYYHREFDKLALISPVLFDKLMKLNYNKE